MEIITLFTDNKLTLINSFIGPDDKEQKGRNINQNSNHHCLCGKSERVLHSWLVSPHQSTDKYVSIGSKMRICLLTVFLAVCKGY